MWTSRDGWLTGLGQWASSSAFAAAKASARVSITAATLLAVAAVMAEHADHGTGRHVAVTRATIADRAGCGPDTVTVAWRLLRVAGWAVEAQRGHGSPATPTGGRRPSVYHLVSRRQPRPAVHNPDLPPKAGVCISSSVDKYSPSARERAVGHPSKKQRPCRAAPRPLPVQQLAAQLVNRCHGLSGTHIGAICEAITAAGIDPQLWSARAVTDALNADMTAHGRSWPDRIERPGAFLASRLRRIEWRPEGPPNNGGCAASPDTTPAPRRGHEPSPPETSQHRPLSTPEGRAAARELFRAAKAARRRATDSHQPVAPPPAAAAMANAAESAAARRGVLRSGQQQVHQQRAAGVRDLFTQVVVQR
ncbi:MAG: rep protein [Actinomycetia bacterium]|nr:rep protein [Actinomycetes bacterium]